MKYKKIVIGLLFCMVFLLIPNVMALTEYNLTNYAGLCDQFSLANKECNVTVSKTISDNLLIKDFSKLNVLGNVNIRVDSNEGYIKILVDNIYCNDSGIIENYPSSTNGANSGDLNLSGDGSINGTCQFITLGGINTNNGGDGGGGGNINFINFSKIYFSKIYSKGGKGDDDANAGTSTGGNGGNIYLKNINNINFGSFIYSYGGSGGYSGGNINGGKGGNGGNITILNSSFINVTTIYSNGGSGGNGYVGTPKTNGGDGGGGGNINISDCITIIGDMFYSKGGNGGDVGGQAYGGKGGNGNEVFISNINDIFLNNILSLKGKGGTGSTGWTYGDGLSDNININEIYSLKNLNITSSTANIYVNNITYLYLNGEVSGDYININSTKIYLNVSVWKGTLFIDIFYFNIYKNITISNSNYVYILIRNTTNQYIPYWFIGTPTNITFNYTTSNEGFLQFDQTLAPTSLLFEWTNNVSKKVQFDYVNSLDVNLWAGSGAPPPPPDNETNKTYYYFSDSFNETVNGTYVNTTVNETIGALVLNSSFVQGYFESAIFDANTVFTRWLNMSWVQGGYYQQELPNNKGIETSLGGANMTGNVLLMHMNELSGTIEDTSGEGNNGTNNGATYGINGKFNTALSFDGSLTNYVQIPALTLTTGKPFVLSAWVKPESTGNYRTIMGYDGAHRLLISSAGQMLSQQDGNFFSGSVGDVPDGMWSYVVYWYNGTTERWYINGIQSGSDHSTLLAEWDTAFKIGQYDLFNYPYNGTIDEVAVWNRSLSSDEILNIYKRGVLRLNLSVRSCDDSACSGESWTDINETSPQNLSYYNIPNNRYFQYIFYLFSENANYTPEIYNVTINYKKIPQPSNSLKILALDNINNQSILVFNATVNNTFYETVNGIILINLSGNINDLINITVNSNNYITRNYNNYNISLNGSNLTAYLTPHVYITSPKNDTGFGNQTGITIYFNMSSDANWCGLYVDNVLANQTNNLLANNNYYLRAPQSAFIEGYNYVQIKCNLTNNQSVESSKVNVWLDTIMPTITTTFKVGQLIYDNNLTGNFSFSDEYLYAYEINIDNNQVIVNDTNLNVSQYNYSLNIKPKDYNLTIGNHYLNVTVSDGHTANEIPKWNYSVGTITKSLVFSFPKNDNEGWVKITAKNFMDLASSLNTKKLKDRYSFIYRRHWFEKAINGKDLHFRVESSERIQLSKRKTKKFPAWMVIPKLHKWIDFRTFQKVGGYKVEQINPNTVDVTIYNVSDDEITFNSIGSLNTVSQTLNFSVIGVNISYVSPVLEAEQNPTNLLVVLNGTNSTDFNASLTYNGVEQTVTRTDNIPDFINFSSTLTSPALTNQSELIVPIVWNLTYGNNSQLFSFNQTVFPIKIIDCRDNTSYFKAVTFNSLDEEANSTTFVNNMSLGIDLHLWVSDENDYKQVSFAFTGGNNYSLCIFPEDAIMYANAIMEYTAPSMANRKYYLDNFKLSNDTQTVNLYHLNYSKASDIIMNVVDKNTGDPISDVFIKVLRYYPELGSYRAVEVEKTDENGQTAAKMVLADVFYKFILEKNRDVVLDTNVQKILTTTKTFYVNLYGDILESFSRIGNINVNVGCDNDTKTCHFTWSDSSNLVKEAQLKIFRRNAYGMTELYSASDSSPAGSLVYVITENTTGNEYIAKGYIETNTTHSFYEVGSDVISFFENVIEKLGKNSLLPALLLIVVLGAVMLDIGGTGVIIGSLIAFIGLSLFGIIQIGIVSVVSLIIMGVVLIIKFKE